MYIRVVSKRKGGVKASRHETVVDISRTSIFGNPFHKETESQRAEVIENYRRWLNKEYRDNTILWQMLVVLAKRVKAGEHVALECWCAPKPCHGDVIKNAIIFIIDNILKDQEPI